MAESNKSAFGAPGVTPYWTQADKDGVGAAYSTANRIWFTLWRGALTEVYYPTVDRAQMRDLQLVITDGQSFVHQEKHDFQCSVERVGDAQAYHVRAQARDAPYGFEKDVICDPHSPCVLQRYRFSGESDVLRKLQVYVVGNPHLEDQGTGATAQVLVSSGRKCLLAKKGRRCVVIGADCGFHRTSCGFAGVSDGLTDLLENKRMDWEFETAESGNTILTGEIPTGVCEFIVCVALGESSHGALTSMLQSFSFDFDEMRSVYLDQWRSAAKGRLDPGEMTGDEGREFRVSCNVLLTHEDKMYEGAMIASLAVPWGEVRKARKPTRAGYHLVWPRDTVNGSSALLASGDRNTPLRALTYLAVAQREDGSFAQNFWIDGEPNWGGLQLDEVTYPVLLARHLHRENALRKFDPRPMVFKAVAYIVHQGPITPQERWEQLSGYSPSTLAVTIASLICAAAFARESGKHLAARFLEEYADWLRDHIERWTVTTCGELHPDVPRHLIRITPATPGDAEPMSPNDAIVKLSNQPPGQPTEYPARNIVDAGFLELVRYGILDAHDPLIVDSLKVADAVLKVETPFGPCWRRFNHDGYGQRDDGSPFQGWGTGRAWPLLTGERGHYELAAGRDPSPYIRTMEQLANGTGLLPEQVWDRHFRSNGIDYFGRPTGSAMPLVWAHAEYIKLVRSAKEGRVFDLMPEVADHYRNHPRHRERYAMWTLHYPTRVAHPGETLRVYAANRFRLRYSLDNWATTEDKNSRDAELDVHFVDVDVPRDQRMPARFTFFWEKRQSWHGSDFAVAIEPERDAR